MSIELIGLFSLEEISQKILTNLNLKDLNRALACNENISTELTNKLAASKDIVTSCRALRKTNDLDLLLKSAYGQRLNSVLWNSNINEEILVEYLDYKDPSTGIIPYLNPTTPKEEIIKRLTPEKASELVEINGNVGDRVVRAYALVMSNPWMHSTPEIWSNTIRRAIAGSPELTLENSEKIRKAGWSGWDSHNLNPIKKGLKVNEIPTKELVKIGSSASDLIAINRDDITLSDAQAITGFGRKDAEPHIIAKIVDKFGIEAMVDISYIAMTRINSASWLNPAVSYCYKLKSKDVTDIKNAITIMESKPESWSTFYTLAKDWNNSYASLAETAVKI